MCLALKNPRAVDRIVCFFYTKSPVWQQKFFLNDGPKSLRNSRSPLMPAPSSTYLQQVYQHSVLFCISKARIDVIAPSLLYSEREQATVILGKPSTVQLDRLSHRVEDESLLHSIIKRFYHSISRKQYQNKKRPFNSSFVSHAVYWRPCGPV